MTDEDYKEQEQDRFEARLFGMLPEVEAAAFDAELAHDAALKERYELFVLSVRGIRSLDASGPPGTSPASSGRAGARRTMRAIDEELDARPTVVRSLFRPWMGWAAAAAVLIGLAGALWFTQGETPQQLAEEFAITELGLPVLMGTSPRAMDAIMNAYKQEDFAAAAGLIDASLERDTMNDTLNYFAGIVAMRMDDCNGAAAHWSVLVSTSEFASRALYNEAICKLRAGDVVGAGVLLNRVMATKDAQLTAKARDLLPRLDRM